MKPIVFYDFYTIGINKVTVEKDKLNKLLDDVYNAGLEDGKNMAGIMYMPIDTNKLDTYKSNGEIDLTPSKVSSQVIFSQL